MAESIFHEVTTTAVLTEKKKLRKNLRLFDMTFYTLAAIVGLDTLGAFSANGSQALTWLIISAVTFLLPYGLLTAELGSTFPQEGGVYEWCKLAGGRFFAAIGTVLYWISNPLWVGGTLSVGAIAAIKTFWFGSTSYQFGGNSATDASIEMLIALFFIWGTTWNSILSLRFGKWACIIGSYVKLLLLGLFAVLALVFLLGGHSHGGSLVAADLIPSNWGLILSGILPVLIFQWVGFELQNGAGEEMENPQRDVPLSLIRSGAIATIAYALFIIFILLALPKSALSNVGSFFAAFQSVVGILPAPLPTVLGWLVALAFIIALASSGSSWIIGADRSYAISALDGAAPIALGRFSEKYGTPVVVNILSGIVATVAMAAAILISAFASGGSLSTLFGLVFGFSTSTSTLSYLFIFPAFLILRYKYPNIPRPYKVPGGMPGAWIVMLFPLAYAALAAFFILIPTAASVANAKVSRMTYEFSQFVPLIIIVLLTTAFFVWGRVQTREKEVTVNLLEDNQVGELHPGTGD